MSINAATAPDSISMRQALASTKLIGFDTSNWKDKIITTGSSYAGNAGNAGNVGTSGGGGTPCYASGSLIRTTRGDVAVENLKVGDHVVTAAGAHRPIVWIGCGVIDLAEWPNRRAGLPIRVKAHAFGKGLPERDLDLSQWHSISFEDVLIPIVFLVNGSSVAHLEVSTVTYWHVELDSHDILIANGLPAESYLDVGNRRFFTDGQSTSEAMEARGYRAGNVQCRPVVTGGPVYDAARALLEARTKRYGGLMAAITRVTSSFLSSKARSRRDAA